MSKNTVSTNTLPKFTLLSETVIQKISPELFTLEESERMTDIILESNFPMNKETSASTSLTKTADDADGNEKSMKKHKQIYTRENHIIIVVLGSLAGVLLVVALTLIFTCLWCQVRTKRHSYSDIFKSSHNGNLTASSNEPPHTLNESSLNGHPRLSHTDAYHNNYLLTSPTPEDPNLQLFGNFNAMLKNQHSAPSWSTLAFGGVGPHQYRGLLSDSLQQPAISPVVNGILSGCNPQTSLSNNGTLNGLFFTSEQTSYKQTTEGDSTAIDSINEEERKDREISDKPDEFGSIPFFPEIADGGQNDQSSSVYSHIDSLSNLNELPPRIYDKNEPKGNSLNSITSPLYIPGQDTQLMRPIPMYLAPQNPFLAPSLFDKSAVFSAFGSEVFRPNFNSSAIPQHCLFYRTLPPSRNLTDPTKQLEMFQCAQAIESNPLSHIQREHQASCIRSSFPPGANKITPTRHPFVFDQTNQLREPRKLINAATPLKTAFCTQTGHTSSLDNAAMYDVFTRQFLKERDNGNAAHFMANYDKQSTNHSFQKKFEYRHVDGGVDLKVPGNVGSSQKRDSQLNSGEHNRSNLSFTSIETANKKSEVHTDTRHSYYDQDGQMSAHYMCQSNSGSADKSHNNRAHEARKRDQPNSRIVEEIYRKFVHVTKED